MGPRRRRTTLAAALVVAVTSLSGCGSEPPASPPSGVDGLTIPDPTPVAADFVPDVTNPWLALGPGARWEYTSDADRTRLVTVEHERVAVQGIATTVVHTEVYGHGNAPTDVRDDLYAQDRAGNVWLLGQRVLVGDGQSWQAGVDGAQAGLAMAAVPRRGDGYAVADARGADEDRAIVLSLDASTSTATGTYEHALLVEYTSELDPGAVVRRTYARGVGLVTEDGVQGTLEHWQLTSVGGSG